MHHLRFNRSNFQEKTSNLEIELREIKIMYFNKFIYIIKFIHFIIEQKKKKQMYLLYRP